MLHRCLSAEHVLIGEDQICKVTGFGYAEDIRDREEYEREEGVTVFSNYRTLLTH